MNYLYKYIAFKFLPAYKITVLVYSFLYLGPLGLILDVSLTYYTKPLGKVLSLRCCFRLAFWLNFKDNLERSSLHFKNNRGKSNVISGTGMQNKTC